jgi:CRISPR-associated endonuclease/helicase Cas3
VDADHGDTARHYGNEVEIPEIKRRWEERLAALQRYVDRLPPGKTERERRRNELRRQVFERCRDAPVEPAIRACDAPVGSGKTTAVMAHLLRVAANAKRGLRHIFVVLPYTNIITQAVEVYRKALVLEGERAEEIVAEHHHRADFEETDLRRYATLWRAPIIVTTAVQFFETLGSHRPAALRKLHELPGSAVFVDEMHAAMPSHLWPQMWRWLETWTREWGGHLVMASGSLARFWELEEYRDLMCEGAARQPGLVPDLVSDVALNEELREVEERRIRYRRRPEEASALDCGGLIGFLQEKEGPRL